MKRMGKLSGKIYTGDEIKTMPECGVPISDEEAANEKFVAIIHAIKSSDCALCRGCPLYDTMKKGDKHG